MSEQKELAVETSKIIKMVARDLVATIGESFVMGHAFLWVTFKAGNKSYKALACSGACGNWDEIQSELIKACPSITYTWINLD